MKVKLIQSVRFRMALYAIMSMLLTFLTEFVIFYFLKIVQKQYFVYFKIPVHSGSTVNISNIADYENGINVKEIFRLFPHSMTNIAILFIISVILFTIYYILVSRKFVDDIQMLLAGVSCMKDGDLSMHIPVQSKDEIGQLTAAVNEMSDSLYQLMEQEHKREKIKNDLITNVAHDLRTPITSIMGYVELLTHPDISKKDQDTYIQVISSKTNQLQSLIESLFEYVKYSGGEIQFDMKVLDISCFIEQITDEFYSDFQKAGLKCKVSVQSDLKVSGDGEKLARAFNNILSNAVKYGSDGKLIKVKVYRKTLKEEQKMVVVDVVNYGKIIEKKDLERLFDKFYRVEESRSLNTGGTGLGLAITKNIVTRHQGTVSASSDENGTVIRVMLPEYIPERE